MNISLDHKRIQADQDSQLATSFIVERVENHGIKTEKRISVSVDELDASLGAIPGALPEGEWILVFQLDEDATDLNKWYCDYTIVGQ